MRTRRIAFAGSLWNGNVEQQSQQLFKFTAHVTNRNIAVDQLLQGKQQLVQRLSGVWLVGQQQNQRCQRTTKWVVFGTHFVRVRRSRSSLGFKNVFLRLVLIRDSGMKEGGRRLEIREGEVKKVNQSQTFVDCRD